MPVDYHIHTYYCGHAHGLMQEYVERGVEIGLKEVGFSGHHYYPEGFQPQREGCVISEKNYQRYLNEAIRLREIYKDKIKVRIGAEIDYLEGFTSQLPSFLEKFPYDFIISSCHYIDGVIIDYNEKLSLENLAVFGDADNMYKRYYETLLNMVKAKLCDVVGHFDLVKKFKTTRRLRSNSDFTDIIDEITDLIKEQGMVVEVNTSGLERGCNEPYPSFEILKLMKDKGISITLGSDSHRYSHVGRRFKEVIKELKNIGFTEVTIFERRTKGSISL